MRRAGLIMALAMLLALAVGTTGAAGATSTSVVMKGLDNPRGLSFAATGALYVAEAGRGGSGPCLEIRGASTCYGASGAVSRLWLGKQDRIVKELPSLITQPGPTGPGGEVTGPHDVAAFGLGLARVTVGWGGDPAQRATLGSAGSRFGSLLTVGLGRVLQSVDVSRFEGAENPAGGELNSNPFGLLNESVLGASYVADAGANALLRVSAFGTVSSVAVFGVAPRPASCQLPPPPFPQPPVSESVPTAVERGPDGALYVAELTGFPFCDKAARIWRIVPGQPPAMVASGFNKVIDIAFDGSDLYVLEYDTAPFLFGAPGRLLRVHADGKQDEVIGGLSHPTSVAVGPDRALYVTNNGDQVGSGEVLRIKP